MPSHHDVYVLLDIGPNAGQLSKARHKVDFGQRIVSFEPFPNPHARLVLESDNEDWQAAPRVAIGDHQGDVEIVVAGNSFSRSILGMLPDHERVAPDSNPVGLERTSPAPLDVAARGLIGNDEVSFIKIDTQDYEDRVPEDAADIHTRADELLIELSFVPPY